MKNIFIVILMIVATTKVIAQTQDGTKGQHKAYPDGWIANTVQDTRFILKNELPTIYINETTNVLFRLPETVQFVDMSGNNLIGDIPVENVARIKLATTKQPMRNLEDRILEADEEYYLENLLAYNEYQHHEEIGIVTITAESFMTQYKVLYASPNASGNVVSNVEVQPNNMFPLEYPKYDLNRTEMQYFSMQALKQKKNKIRSKSNSKINLQVNNIFVVGDFFFIDISVRNRTNIPYSIEDFKFSIQDKKIYKATNNQSINIEPIYKLYSDTEIKRNYRNVFVFRKFTFPNKRYFNIRLLEEQISGRTVEVDIKYKDILSADKL